MSELNLTRLAANLDNISSLSDSPWKKDNLSTAELKAKFDKAGNDIKSYINETLITELKNQAATKEEIQGIALGDVPDGTISKAKLSMELKNELNNIYGVDNNVSKALFYPNNMSSEDLNNAKLQNTYTGSQIASILDDIEVLTKKYTELKYQSIITGNSTTGYIQNTNINFSSLPYIKSQSGTSSFSTTGNEILLATNANTSGIGIIEFPYGSKIKSLLAQYYTNGSTTSINLKVYYSTDNGETYTRITNIEQKDTSNISNGHDIPGSDGTWIMGSVLYEGAPNLTEWTIDSIGETTITNIKFEVSNLWTGSTSSYSHDIRINFYPTVANSNNDLKVLSKTGMWNGGTGSMNTDDSGILTLSEALPINTYVSVCIGVNNDWEASDYNVSDIKTMNLQGSNNGTTWTSIADIRASKFFKYGIEQYVNWYNLTPGYKYYRFYTDQSQTSNAEPCTAIYLKGISYTKTESTPKVTSDIAESTQTISNAFYVLEDDNKVDYKVSITVDPNGTPITTEVEEGTSTTAVTNTASSKLCAFTIEPKSAIIGTTKINSFMGAFI